MKYKHYIYPLRKIWARKKCNIDEYINKVAALHIKHLFSLGNTTALSSNHLHVTSLRPGLTVNEAVIELSRYIEYFCRSYK